MRHTFFCIDAHTCGNPVRVVAAGAPQLPNVSMAEKRVLFQRDHDWVRTALMFEPRGHDVMSGTILYPSSRADCDIGVLFIEVSGCLPMCGHGTIGTVTAALEAGLVNPSVPGRLSIEAPAGRIDVEYEMEGPHVREVRLFNVASYLHARDIGIAVPGLGEITVDLSYGGNFYAIIEPQQNYAGLDALPAGDVIRLSPTVRRLLNEKYSFVHPADPAIKGLSHVQWTGAPRNPEADARNAVFYGEKAIDRSPCGTGTSARMAQLASRGVLKPGDEFVHESIIGSLFRGRVETATTVGGLPAIVPSIEGWARITGFNTIFIDDDDPYRHGFQVL